jgi:hypothetical protein
LHLEQVWSISYQLAELVSLPCCSVVCPDAGGIDGLPHIEHAEFDEANWAAEQGHVQFVGEGVRRGTNGRVVVEGPYRRHKMSTSCRVTGLEADADEARLWCSAVAEDQFECEFVVGPDGLE